MSEFPWNQAFTLIGVIVGFSLAQVTQFLRASRRKRAIKKALLHELSVARDTLSHALTNESRLPKSYLPIITEVYDTSKHRLALILEPKQLSVIQMAYAQIKQVSSYL